MFLNYLNVSKESKKTLFAVLIDPDKMTNEKLRHYVTMTKYAAVDFFLVGGSILTFSSLKMVVDVLKAETNLPVIIFPGSSEHIYDNADSLLFLNLISGRNPEYLIGHQFRAAAKLQSINLDVVSTAYMLIDARNESAVAYVSNTTPLPYDQPKIAAQTAFAGELMGNKLVYLDAGSGAKHAISAKIIEAVSEAISLPLIVGGGIKTPEMAKEASDAGADVVVVGNIIENEPFLMKEFAEALQPNKKIKIE